MRQSLFSILSTYKPTENNTPEENFSTELLVYLLNNSIQKGSLLFSQFMERLTNKPISIESYPQFTISTQKKFDTLRYGKAEPDITIIESAQHYYFIEVKVESELNHYQTKTDEKVTMINQIEKYQDIKVGPKSLFLLTKYTYEHSFENCQDFKSHLKWLDIYKLLESYQGIDEIENYLISETKKYMEDHRMTIPKVSYELIKGMESVKNLVIQLERCLKGIPNIERNISDGRYWFGYNINIKGKTVAWVAISLGWNKLLFKHMHKKVVDYLKYNPKGFKGECKDNYYYTYFNFEENHYFCLTAEQQLDMLKKWIDDNYNLIKESLEKSSQENAQ